MDRKQLVSFSEIASFLRVPLMVLVVCIHGVGSDIQTINFVNHLPILSIGNVICPPKVGQKNILGFSYEY